MKYYLLIAGLLLLSSVAVAVLSLRQLRRAFVQGIAGPGGGARHYLLCSSCGAAVHGGEVGCPHCGRLLPSPAEIRAQWKMAKSQMRQRSRLMAALMSLADSSVEARITALSQARKPPVQGVVIDGAPVSRPSALPPGETPGPGQG